MAIVSEDPTTQLAGVIRNLPRLIKELQPDSGTAMPSLDGLEDWVTAYTRPPAPPKPDRPDVYRPSEPAAGRPSQAAIQAGATAVPKAKKEIKLSPFAPCRECSNRLSYKTYYKRGYLPLAVIHFTWERYSWEPFYANPVADDLFKRMLKNSLGKEPGLFHHLEVLGCNIPPTKSGELISEYASHCRRFVADYCQKNNIEAVIVMGEAAAALFGREKAAELTGDYHPDLLSLGGDIGGIIVRSPMAMIYAEKKGDRALYKEVAQTIHSGLQAFKKELPHYF